MYLGFVTVLLGIAVLMGSLKPYAGVFVFAIFMDVIFIRFEEKKLEPGEYSLEISIKDKNSKKEGKEYIRFILK